MQRELRQQGLHSLQSYTIIQAGLFARFIAINSSANVGHSFFHSYSHVLTMPVVMHRRIAFSNEFVELWTPEVKVVDNVEFVRLDPKDRTFFRFCTDDSIRLGRQSDESRYLLKFFTDMVRSRAEACQAAFEKMQTEAADGDAGEGAKVKKRRFRRACDGDAETVGHIIEVTFEHLNESVVMNVLFGMKNAPLWVEATVANISFISAAMKDDYANHRFADTRPRGPCFKRSAEDADGAHACSDGGPAAAGA